MVKVKDLKSDLNREISIEKQNNKKKGDFFFEEKWMEHQLNIYIYCLTIISFACIYIY